jgi:hypothetical protein
MAVRIRQGLGLPVPTDGQIKFLLKLAHERDSATMQQLVMRSSVVIERPEPGAFFVVYAPAFGVGVCIDDGFLYADHRLGVCWTHLQAMLNPERIEWRHWA